MIDWDLVWNVLCWIGFGLLCGFGSIVILSWLSD